MRHLERADRSVCVLSGIAFCAAGACLCFMVLLVAVDVIMRSVFDTSIYIAPEFSGYSLVGSLFLGMPYALRRGEFVQVELVYERLGPRAKLVIDIFVHLMSMLFVGALAWYSLLLVIESYQFSITSTEISRTPLYLPQSLMVLGAVLLLAELAIGLLKRLFLKESTIAENIHDDADGSLG